MWYILLSFIFICSLLKNELRFSWKEIQEKNLAKYTLHFLFSWLLLKKILVFLYFLYISFTVLQRVRDFYIILKIFSITFNNKNPVLQHCCNKRIIQYRVAMTSRLLGIYISIQQGENKLSSSTIYDFILQQLNLCLKSMIKYYIYCHPPSLKDNNLTKNI